MELAKQRVKRGTAGCRAAEAMVMKEGPGIHRGETQLAVTASRG